MELWYNQEELFGKTNLHVKNQYKIVEDRITKKNNYLKLYKFLLKLYGQI